MITFTYPKWIFNHACGQLFPSHPSPSKICSNKIQYMDIQYPMIRATIQAFQFHFSQIWVFVLWLFHRSMTRYLICTKSFSKCIPTMQNITIWDLQFLHCAQFVLLCSSNSKCFGCWSEFFYIVQSWKIRDCLCHFLAVSHQLFALHNAQEILRKYYQLFSSSDRLAFTRTAKRKTYFHFSRGLYHLIIVPHRIYFNLLLEICYRHCDLSAACNMYTSLK